MRVGILGGGQLGRMTALAGAPLGFEFRALDPAADASAGQVCEHVRGDFSDPRVLDAFCAGLDAATYEWENVPLAAALEVARRVPNFFPPPAALEMAQDRLDQKNFMTGLGLETAPYVAVDSLEGLRAAVAGLGLPAVLKTRRHGYDGKGQFVLRDKSDAEAAWRALGGAALILEGFVRFDREVSLVAARARDGSFCAYAVTENRHEGGILRVSLAPAPGLATGVQARAEAAARALMERLGYVGVLTIEFFEVGDRLLINEVATRVHNSGHWTMDGAETSQFENHLRAGLGMKLGGTALVQPTVMVNLIGTVPPEAALRAIAGARVHLYGKEPRPGRKLGHVNVPVVALPEVLALL